MTPEELKGGDSPFFPPEDLRLGRRAGHERALDGTRGGTVRTPRLCPSFAAKRRNFLDGTLI